MPMQLRSVERGANYRLEGQCSDTGTEAEGGLYGTIPLASLESQAGWANLLVANSNGGIEYDAECHDPFD